MTRATHQLPDGRVFVTEHLSLSGDHDGQLDWWTEGNAGCDCNKSIWLNEQHDLDLPEECGVKIKLLSLVVDGKELYETN